jgi:hypothetical protein
MKRTLGHSFLAVLGVTSLFLSVHFTGLSRAQASVSPSGHGSALDGLAASMGDVTLELDDMLKWLVGIDNSMTLGLALPVESRESMALADRMLELRSAVDVELPAYRADAFVLDTRIKHQREYIREIFDNLSQREQMIESLPTTVPAVGRLSSGFGYRIHPIYGVGKLHTGVDIAAPTGTPIYAASGGVVAFAGRRNGYGNTIELDHGFGYHSLYGHSSKLLVKTGDTITRGQLIALVGSTGASTGSHLHFEVIVDSTKVDPLPFLGLKLPEIDVPTLPDGSHSHDDVAMTATFVPADRRNEAW